MFRKLLSIEEAKQILKESFSPEPVGVELVSVPEAHNRVLAKDIVAQIDIPPFHRATVDGYAVRAVNTFGADEDRPISLKLCGRIGIGETPSIVVENGTVAEISTGAPVPQGANAVVMLEYAVQEGETILIYRSIATGENVMRAGSDIHKGETILREGRTLSSREIGVLAALGLTRVDVYKRPRVAVISTGAEIVEPGKHLPSGKIYDINAYTLSAAISECGGSPINFGIIPDDADRIKATLKEALKSADVVITSGGVSVGPGDLIPRVLNQLGKPGVIVCGIASKPGKPTTIAMIDGKLVFGMPGHPTSSLLMFYQFVRPLICSMAGRREEASLEMRATATDKMFSARGRRTFIMVNLTHDKSGRLLASPILPGVSGAITTLAKAEGFVEIHESWQFIDAGDEVTVHLFKPLHAIAPLE